jgi:2-amino-4-hydroxy-6-hydroxymethyldihydropteridine diphosphokinase
MVLAHLSLGSNLGDREAQLRQALVQLAALGDVISVSSFYETEPVDFIEQPWFLNCAVALATNKTPEELMTSLLEIERQMGRQRGREKGPRLIDLDILLFDDCVVRSSAVTIPHPAMHKRRFVLEPLAEIAPDVMHPILKKTIRELLDALPPAQKVRKLHTSGSCTTNCDQ